jgi:hypothetical protein
MLWRNIAGRAAVGNIGDTHPSPAQQPRGPPLHDYPLAPLRRGFSLTANSRLICDWTIRLRAILATAKPRTRDIVLRAEPESSVINTVSLNPEG